MANRPEQAFINQISIQGYKSIKDITLVLRPINVIIGANGAGKSNLIGFFNFLNAVTMGHLQHYTSQQRDPNAILHFGSKSTEKLSAHLQFGLSCNYSFALEESKGRFIFSGEGCSHGGGFLEGNHLSGPLQGYLESRYAPNETLSLRKSFESIFPQWQIWHLQDTSENAKIKQVCRLNDNFYLKQDGRNLAAFLYLLANKYPENYTQIINTLKLVAPFFDSFILRPKPLDIETIMLEWVDQSGHEPLTVHDLSDGTLRFICLVTALCQPDELMPNLLILDEPELGLHPYALGILAELIQSVSVNYQVLVSTQSVELLNSFNPEDVIVTDKVNGETTFTRFESSELTDWLEQYSLGELWQKNILGGRPH